MPASARSAAAVRPIPSVTLLPAPRVDQNYANLPWISLSFSVDDPIVPGKPLNLSWQLWSYNLALGLGNLKAEILLGQNAKNSIYTSSKPVPYVITKNTGDSGVQTIPPLSPKSLPPDLYQVGAKTLRLVITGDGADKGPYIADADLTVVEETLGPDWWQWVAPVSAKTQPTVKWKEKYKIAARALNHAQSDMRFESSLFELPHDVHIWKPRSKATNMIAAGKVADVVFTDEIEQDWQWIIPGVWIIPAQVEGLGTTRAFDYKVNLSLTDGFGNGYDPFDSGLFRVYVKVSDVKVALGLAAEAHMVIAHILTMAGLISLNPWVLGAGGSAATEAQALGAGALDPPDPDPLFREAVGVSLPPPASMGSGVRRQSSRGLSADRCSHHDPL